MVHLGNLRPGEGQPYRPDFPIACMWGADFSSPPTITGLELETNEGLVIKPNDRVSLSETKIFWHGKEVANPQALIEDELVPIYFGTRNMFDALKVSEERGIGGWFFQATVTGGMIGTHMGKPHLVGSRIYIEDTRVRCPFCESGEVRSRMIMQHPMLMVFAAKMSIVPGHVLICPKRCVATASELTTEELITIFQIRIRVTDILKEAFGATGFNYAWNEGKVAGQTVFHFHLHVVPRQEGDIESPANDPRQYLYRTGEREITPLSDIRNYVEKMRSVVYK